MLITDIPNLRNIHIAKNAVIPSYRYDAVIEYGGGISHYHPNCIPENRRYLIDYIDICKRIIDNINTIINVENQEHKFMVNPNLTEKDVEFFNNRLNVKIYKIADLTIDQAQEIINNNMYWITQAQADIHERVLINKINKSC